MDLYSRDEASVRIIDKNRIASKKGQLINPFIRDFLLESIQKKQKTMLFYNKKGFSALKCSYCKEMLICKKCERPFVYYSSAGMLLCPLCGKTIPYAETCSICGKGYFQSRGVGIERFIQALCRFFPEAKIVQLEKSKQNIKDADIVLSTSLIFSMRDSAVRFDKIMVFDIDSVFYRMEYDTSVKAFTLLANLKERADKELVILTEFPDHSVIKTSGSGWRAFFEEEAVLRRKYHLPPSYGMVLVRIRSREGALAEKRAHAVKKIIDAHKGMEIVGPIKESPYKLRD